MSGLGKGLDELLNYIPNDSNSINTDKIEKNNVLVQIPIDKLTRGKYQPRQLFDEESLIELADSIKKQGIIQPIVARKIDDNRYEILAGERRWLGAQKAGLTMVPVVIKNVDDRQAIAISLIENIQRKDLNVIEQSEALKRLVDEFNFTHEQVGEIISKSRSQVSNLLRLNDLNDGVKDFVFKGLMEMGHARTLLSIDKDKQLNVAEYIISKKFNVRETEKYVKKFLENPEIIKETQKIIKTKDQNTVEWENDISKKIGCKQVKIFEQNNGKGKVVLTFSNVDELEKIKNYLKNN